MSDHDPIIVLGSRMHHVARSYDYEDLDKEPQHRENDGDDIWGWTDPPVLDWLTTRCTGKWAVFTDDGEEVAAFEHEADRILFTDTWTGGAR